MNTGTLLSTLLWILANTSAAVLVSWELWQAHLDGRYIDAMGWNGPMHIVLRRDFRVNLARLALALNYDLLGIFVLALPAGALLTRIDFTVVLLLSAAMLIVNAIWDRRSRHFVARAEGHTEGYLPSMLRVRDREKTPPPPSS